VIVIFSPVRPAWRSGLRVARPEGGPGGVARPKGRLRGLARP